MPWMVGILTAAATVLEADPCLLFLAMDMPTLAATHTDLPIHTSRLAQRHISLRSPTMETTTTEMNHTRVVHSHHQELTKEHPYLPICTVLQDSQDLRVQRPSLASHTCTTTDPITHTGRHIPNLTGMTRTLTRITKHKWQDYESILPPVPSLVLPTLW